MEITSDRRFDFGVAPEELWSTIALTDLYREWWPWLHGFEGTSLQAGESWSCEIRPPVPYAVRVTIDLVEIERPNLVVAAVSGDIAGSARLTIVAAGDGSVARLRSTLAPRRPLLRGLAAVAPHLVRFGHEWVLDTGGRQLAEHLGPSAADA